MYNYKSELERGLRQFRDEVADAYRPKMKRYHDAERAVDERRHFKVGSRAFMKLPTERRRSKHPKLTQKWDGPFRMWRSLKITRTAKDEEPLRILMNLSRVTR